MEIDFIKNEIIILLSAMGFGQGVESIDVHQGSAVRFSVHMRGNVSMLIGERGNNLVALEHILKKIINKKKGEEEQRFTLDVNDYRMQRLEDLKQDVKNAAREVRLYHRDSPLRPMSSFERRIVHLLLEEYPDIRTESSGFESERHVIIKPYP